MKFFGFQKKVLIKDVARGLRNKGRGEEKRGEKEKLRDRVAFPIENRGKPTSAYLEAPIPI